MFSSLAHCAEFFLASVTGELNAGEGRLTCDELASQQLSVKSTRRYERPMY